MLVDTHHASAVFRFRGILAFRRWRIHFQITGRLLEDPRLVRTQKGDGSWGTVRDTAAAVRILVTKYRYDRVFR
jgi:hypothetical protein